MTTSNTPDQRIDEILTELMEYSHSYGKGDIPTSENPPLIIARKTKSALRAIAEEMMAEVVGDTVIPPKGELWRYTPEGVAKFMQLYEQRQRIPQVINKYFGGGE